MGDKDIAAGTVSVRLRTDQDLGALPVEQVVEMIAGVIASKALDLA